MRKKEKFVLGGLPQTVETIGKGGDAPLILYLHGGPGLPERHYIFVALSPLTEKFTIAAWDQRGCGGSYSGCDPESISLSTYLSDCHELVCQLLERYSKSKIIMMGGSWGSLLAVKYAAAHPELVEAYIGFSQIVDSIQGESISYEAVLSKAKAAGDTESVRELEELGAPEGAVYGGDSKNLVRERAVVSRYGGLLSDPKKASILRYNVLPVLRSSHYSFAEKLGIIRGQSMVSARMTLEYPQRNILDIKELSVPVLIYHGAKDGIAPLSLVEGWMASLSAPYKRLVIEEDGRHALLSEKSESFCRLCSELIDNL